MKKMGLFVCAVTIMGMTMATPVSAHEETTTTQQTSTTLLSSEGPVVRQQYGYITANNVNFRRSAGLSGTIIRQLNYGDEVGLTSSTTVKDGIRWRYIQYNGIGGWVADQYVQEYIG